MNNTAKNFKSLLVAKGLSQSAFARKFNKKTTTVANWVRGVNAMPLDIIIEICKEYGISLDDFILGELKVEITLSA